MKSKGVSTFHHLWVLVVSSPFPTPCILFLFIFLKSKVELVMQHRIWDSLLCISPTYLLSDELLIEELRWLFLQSEIPVYGVMKRPEKEIRLMSLLSEKVSPALHPAWETTQRQCGLQPAETIPNVGNLSFLARVHEWAALIFIPKCIVRFCRLSSQLIRHAYIRVGFCGALLCVVGLTCRQRPFCPWGGGRSGQGACGWLFFLRKTLTSSLLSGFCGFYLLSDANIMTNIPGCCWKEGSLSELLL